MAHNSETLVTYGNGGWAKMRSRDAVAYVRVAEVEGRLRVVELYVPTDEGVTPTTLQRLPLADFEAMVNTFDPQHEFRMRMKVAGPDLRSASAFYATTPGRRAKPDHWPSAMLMAQYPDSGLPPAAPPDDHWANWLDMLESDDAIDAVVNLPASKPYGDEFFMSVAAVYRSLVKAGVRSPGQAIATANHVPVSSAHGWIKQARQRGFLPPGARGKSG